MRTSNIIGIAASALLLASCEFLDVVPAKRADFEDAMKNKYAVENWIYGRGYHEIQWQNPFTTGRLNKLPTTSFCRKDKPRMKPAKKLPYVAWYDNEWQCSGYMVGFVWSNRLYQPL